MQKIKVAHTEWMDAWGGETQRVLNELLLIKDNAEFEPLLVCKKNCRLYIEAKKENIKTYHLPFSGNLDFYSLFKLISIFKKENIAIVNTHSSKDSWIGSIASKVCGCKLIRTRHFPLFQKKASLVYKLPNAIITTGQKIKEDLERKVDKKSIKIVSIASSPNEFIFDPKKFNKDAIREEFGFNKSDIIVGSLSGYHRVKNLSLFVEIAKETLKKYPNIKFVIAGNGNSDYKKEIINLISKYELKQNFTLLNYIEKPEVFLSIVDIYLLTSESEGIPQALMQAMMMQISAISTNVGSIEDLNIENNLLLSEKDDIKSMLENLLLLIENSKKREEIANLNREIMLSNFSLKIMKERLINLYKEIL